MITFTSPGLQRDRPATGPQGQPPALVIGLDSVTGLQTARILAARHVPVIGLAERPGHPCCRTRACRRVVRADTSGPGLVDAILGVVSGLREPPVLVPCTDLSVLQLSRHRDRLAGVARFALPDAEVVETLVDKERFYSFAADAGLPIPRTLLVHDRGEAEVAASALRYPAILKPAVKTPAWSAQARKAYRVEGPEELLAIHARYGGLVDCLVAQEWIEGGDPDHYTCNCYFDAESRPLVTFTTRKLRQWPVHGGEACLGEEVENEAVVEETVRLFRAVGLRGLGYLELKRDSRTGELRIIEPNIGRPTGRSATAEAAGVELLLTLYQDLLGRPLPANRAQTYRGVKWIHLRRDLQAAAHHWWSGDLTFRDWTRSLRGPKTEALFSWRDPVPFWADLARVGGKLPGARRSRGAR